MQTRYHVQLLETAADSSSSLPARELLPWADPYIAALMGRLDENDDEPEEDELEDEPTWDFDSEQLDKDDEAKLANALTLDEDDWHLDRVPAVPPIYGGWPLLNDVRPESRYESA